MRKLKKKIINDIKESKIQEKNKEPLPQMLKTTSCSSSIPQPALSSKASDENQMKLTTPFFDEIFSCVDNLSLNGYHNSRPVEPVAHDKFFITDTERSSFSMPNVKISYVNCVNDTNNNFLPKHSHPNPYSTIRDGYNKASLIGLHQRKANYLAGMHRSKMGSFDDDDSRELHRKYNLFKEKVHHPRTMYNSIGSFPEKMNNQLGRISHSYGKIESRVRFVENPILKTYWKAMPVFGIYKDLKMIENRYVDAKFKFKMMPLTTSKGEKFNKLGEKFYKHDHFKSAMKDIFGLS